MRRGNSSNIEVVMEQGKELIAFYRTHPCMAAYELLKVDLAPIQRIIFKDMWFKNYSISICGRGTGKSSAIDSLTFIDNVGLCYLYEQFPGIPDFLRSGETLELEYDKKIYTSEGFKSTKNISLEKNISGLKLITKYGFEHRGSCHHPLLTVDENLNFYYKQLQDFEPNDSVCIQRDQNVFGNNDISEEDAYLIGLFVGCGSTRNFQAINIVDEEILDFCINYCKKYNISYVIDEDKKHSPFCRIIFKGFTWFFDKYKIKWCVSYYKQVPYSIRMATRKAQVKFLNGYFDCVGVFDGHGVSCCSVSKKLMKEIHMMLLNFGIVSKLKEKKTKSKFGKMFLLEITSDNMRIFYTVIGFGLTKKGMLLHNYLEGLDVKLKYVSNTNYYFDRVESVEEWSGDCYDFEMDMVGSNVEPNYFCNGFINHNTYLLGLLATLSCMLYPGYRVGLMGAVFRQSKNIFSEVEKLYYRSSILQEACERKPVRGSDAVYLKFKSVGGMTGSYIEGLPIGDGGKIRGSRFYLLCIDELAQIPEKIIDLVIRPMGATTLEPMENVRRLEKQNKLIELGLATEDDFEEDTINKMIMVSSGFYKFNHMWQRMRSYWKQIEIDGEKDTKFSVHQVPYWDLPEGFLDKDNVAEAKRVMSNSEFRMEYEAAMISESEGFFKASLLEACTTDSGFSIEIKGKADAQYIVGVDPNQGGRASTGVCVIKLGTINKIVSVGELDGKTTQDITKAVQAFCSSYNVVRIFIDKGGGGKAVCDLLEDGFDGYEPLIDRTNKDHRHMEGRHILEMVTFNPSWISDANFTTLSLFEDKKLRFPEPPTSTLDADAIIYEKIKLLKSQMLNIIVTQTSSGLLHFDTPKKDQKKDIYSALILAAHGIREYEKEMNPEPELVLQSIGLVRANEPGARFSPVGTISSSSVKSVGMLSGAVLKRKIK